MSADLNWFKSSYSGGQGGECLEVALTWAKSTYSGAQSGECVEVASCPSTIHIRDSKHPTAPALTVTPTTWTTFLATLG
jgi:hypothetical protein